jgi:aspartyl/glutamyl-tRNA(Asn/Gln) amidotransferase C subunit
VNLDQRTLVHVARLARLRSEAAEAERLSEDLSRILAYFTVLDEWTPDSELPAPEERGGLDLLRADHAEETLTQTEALSCAPETEGGEFTVPAVVRHDSRDPEGEV